MRNYIFIDTETTGLDPNVDTIISIGLIVGNNEYYWKVIPESSVGMDAARINGYTKEGWKDAVPFASIVDILNKLWAGHIMVAHNASFDYSFIKAAFKRANVKCSLDYHLMDTVTLALEHTDLTKVNLSAVSEYFGINPEGAHNALVDARLCKAIFEQLYRQGAIMRICRKLEHWFLNI